MVWKVALTFKVLIIRGWLSVSVCAGVSKAPASQPFHTLIFVCLLHLRDAILSNFQVNETDVECVPHSAAVEALKQAGNTVRLVSFNKKISICLIRVNFLI